MRNFKSIIEVVEHHGGAIFSDNALINYEKREDDKKGIHRKSGEEYRQVVRGKLMGVALIKRANTKNTKLLTSVRNQHSFNFDVYPKMLHHVYKLLEHCSSSTHQNRHHDGSGRHNQIGT